MKTNPEIIEKLQDLIKNGDEVDRCYAIRGIATLNNTDSNELLIQSLRDDDIDVCVDAAAALGKVGGEFAVDKLIESFLNDPDGEVKVACIEALVNLGDEKVIPHLLKTTIERPEEMMFEGADWDRWWDMQLMAIRGLGKMKVEEAVPVLKKLIEEDDYLDIESEIFNALAIISGPADEYLLTLLIEGVPRIRRRVARSLGNSDSKGTLKILARALQDKDADVREATIQSLLQRNAVQYLPAILLSFRDSNAGVRQLAVKVAYQLSEQASGSSSEDLINKLIPLLHDHDPDVKTSAVTILKNLKWKPDRENEEFIISQLRACKGDCFIALCRFVEALELDDAIATLLFMFRHDELGNEEKAQALMTLGHFKQWNAVIEDVIGSCVFDENKAVRLNALEALAEIDKGQSHKISPSEKQQIRQPIDMIVEALHGTLDAPVVAGQTVIPIVPVDDVNQKFESVEASNSTNIKSEHSDSSKNTQSKEPEACTKLLDNALQEISKSIADGEKPMGMTTLDAMAITQVEKSLEAEQRLQENEAAALVEEQEQDQELEEFLALSKQNTDTADWLFNRNKASVDVDIQRLSARILGSTGSIVAIPALLKSIDSEDTELKREAILSLVELLKSTTDQNINDDLRDNLVATLDEEDRDLRIAAARALGELGSSAEIKYLLPKLQDSEMAMRIQTLSALSKLAMSSKEQELNVLDLATQILNQLNNNETGVHRAVVDALVPLLNEKLNGNGASLKQTAIGSLINAGLSGTNGQVKEMSWGLHALDKELSSARLLEKLDQVSSSVERRYVVEMLGELHRPVV